MGSPKQPWVCCAPREHGCGFWGQRTAGRVSKVGAGSQEGTQRHGGRGTAMLVGEALEPGL